MQVATILRRYKDMDGNVNMPAVLSIPSTERIPVMAQQDFMKVNLLIVGALTMAFQSLNLKKPPTPDMILDISETIIEESGEDNLAFEDFMLFLQKLTRGVYDVNLEGIDVPKFMKYFELYRQERFEALQTIRYEQHVQHKGLGNATKSAVRNELDEHFASMGDRVHELKQQINNLKEQNNSLKMDNL